VAITIIPIKPVVEENFTICRARLNVYSNLIRYYIHSQKTDYQLLGARSTAVKEDSSWSCEPFLLKVRQWRVVKKTNSSLNVVISNALLALNLLALFFHIFKVHLVSFVTVVKLPWVLDFFPALLWVGYPADSSTQARKKSSK